MDHAFGDQLCRHGGAKAINIHRIPRSKMNDIAQSLRRALRIDAAKSSLILQVDHRCSARGTDGRHLVGLRILGMGGHRNDLPE